MTVNEQPEPVPTEIERPLPLSALKARHGALLAQREAEERMAREEQAPVDEEG